MIEKSPRWQKTVVAAAAIAWLGFSATEVSALSLGRITVQSSLGEPLRAEIDLPSITPEEAASLKTGVAPASAFVAAGLDYNPVMSGLQATLAKKPDGRSYLRLTTDRAIHEPFVDMILEATWSSGRIVRDFTMLFDPPALKQASNPNPTLPQTAPAPAPAAVPATAPSAPAVTTPAASAVPAPAAPTPASKPSPAASPALAAAPARATPAAKEPTPAPAAADGAELVVRSGDSASKIVLRSKPPEVSLDQMLVALLRANPDAFTQGNLNRLRAGAVLKLPSASNAKAVPAAEASQIVTAQSKDFNAFRRGLASSVPATATEAANRKATGQVNAQVEDAKSNSAADKLTLSKGAVKAKADEAKLAKERADAEAANRAAELAKNIEDLKKISAATAAAKAAAPAASAPAPAAPALAVAAPQVSASAAPAAVSSAPMESASYAAPPASAPAKGASGPSPAAEPSLLEQLQEDPTLPLAGGGLLALLGGWALVRRLRNRKASPTVDSSFLESKLQTESYFGSTGGEQVNTAHASTGASSLGFANGPAPAPDDVDPVAEADVYLAYGRDLQAEEILKAALPARPERLAIHTKLLEIYAKRKDAPAFQSAAQAAFSLTGAEHPEWDRICGMGRAFDPDNALYQTQGSATATEPPQASLGSAYEATKTLALDGTPLVSSSDLDLDLDFSLDEGASDAAAPASAEPSAEPAEPNLSVPEDNLGLEFEISPGLVAMAEGTGAQPADSLPDFSQALNNLELELDAPASVMPEAPTPVEPTWEPEPASPSASAAASTMPVPLAATIPAPLDDGMLEFDLGSLSLDLDSPSGASGVDLLAPPDDHALETKLALAEEFIAIGDQDGARALIEEVVAEAAGDLRTRAQQALGKLN